MHASGFVLQDVCADSFVWLPQESRWTCQSMSTIVRTGDKIATAQLPPNAAPEVRVAAANSRPVEAVPAEDCWAMGIVAAELLMGGSPWDPAGLPSELVCHLLRTSFAVSLPCCHCFSFSFWPPGPLPHTHTLNQGCTFCEFSLTCTGLSDPHVGDESHQVAGWYPEMCSSATHAVYAGGHADAR
jgi:hypothetical protein